MFSKNRIDDGAHSACAALDADAVAERETARSLLARPFYWLCYLALACFLIFLWSAQRVEGMSATDFE
jgi:hypothetical protein